MKDSQAWRRYTTLGDVLTIMEAVKRSFSKNGSNQSPKAGYEEAYMDIEARMQIIRGMMIEERTKAETEE